MNLIIKQYGAIIINVVLGASCMAFLTMIINVLEM